MPETKTGPQDGTPNTQSTLSVSPPPVPNPAPSEIATESITGGPHPGPEPTVQAAPVVSVPPVTAPRGRPPRARPRAGRTPSAVVIAVRFKQYDKSMRDIWEVYWFAKQYFPIIHSNVHARRMPPLSHPTIGGQIGVLKTLSRKSTFGAVSHFLDKVIPPRTLLAAVSATESFLQALTRRVLEDFPHKLSASSQPAPEDAAREGKLLDIIIKSASREEMLDQIIEERLRSLFYGSPADFFIKDKTKLEFDNYFKENYPASVQRYVEVAARRNVWVHNEGRVDRKYLREVGKASALSMGDRATITDSYLRESMHTLRGLAAKAAWFVSEHMYKSPPGGALFRRARGFKDEP